MSWRVASAACVCLAALFGWASSPARAQQAEVEAEDFEQAAEGDEAAEGTHGAGAAEATEEGDHGHGAAAGGHGGVNPLLFDPDLAIFTLIIFLLLLAVLWKFAWGPIAAGLDKREQGIADNIAAAQASHEQAKALLAQYEQKLAAAAAEVRGILDEARRDAEHTQQEILAKARADARSERDRAIREIEIATDAALKELAERSTNLAIDLAGKIVQAQLKPADHARLIEEAMTRFPQAPAGRN